MESSRARATHAPGSAAARLRALLSGPELVVAPFVFDALQARGAEAAGFRAVYMTGFGTAASRGYPDLGLITADEMVANARYIARAVRVPLIADADTGYGNPVNVWRTVCEYEAAGVAALHLEDQVWPKRCGFLAGKQVIPREEMVAKLRAALDAREGPLVVIGRTDALAVAGWDETEARARAYHEAGADLVFVDGIRTREELETYAERLSDVPRLYNGTAPVEDVQALGFRLMICGATLLGVYAALRRAFAELARTGRIADADPAQFGSLLELCGVPDAVALERRYRGED